jgi:selenocysteine lyase/cysteine desulfurase
VGGRTAQIRGGTPNIADVIAFGAALDYLGELGWAMCASTKSCWLRTRWNRS